MSDSISRADAISVLEIFTQTDVLGHTPKQIVEALPSAQPEQRWIPVAERLPETGKVVLWCNEKGSVFTTAITVRNNYSWAVGKRHRFSRVIAWMPLPEPWKGEQPC